MLRLRAVTLPLIALITASVTMTGCSSNDDSGKSGADNSAGSTAAGTPAGDAVKDSGKGTAHLTYSGGDTGEFTIKSVACAVVKGKITAITAPDVSDTKASTTPAFTAVVTDGEALATLVTPGKKTYVHTATSGITSQKTNGAWVATLAGVKLGPTDVEGDSITVDGTITCGSVAGS